MEQSDKCYGDFEKEGMINSVYLGRMPHKGDETMLTPYVQGKEKVF